MRPARPRVAVGTAAILAVVLAPATAWTQTTTPPAPPPVVAGWQNGFFLQSADGDVRLQLGAVVQVDGRFALDDPTPVVNTFSVRKARVILNGRMGKYVDVRLMPDFGNGSTTLLDAYFDLRFSPGFRVRFGKDKSPVGHEVLMGDAALLFPERALPSSLLPNRDAGIQVQGELAGGRVSYAGGILNGVVDGTSNTTELDTNNSKDLAGRLVVQPFRGATGSARPFAGLGVQLGGSQGDETGALPSFKTSIGQTYFSYAAADAGAPATAADGRRTRLTPAIFYYARAFGAFGEYARSTQVIARGARTATITNRAWDVTALLNLTGEPATPAIVSPSRAFDPPARHWGALQAVVRYARLTVDDAVFAEGFASPTASRGATQFTAGVNWYPVQQIKYYVNFERISFDRDGPAYRPIEHAIFLRMQLAF